MTITKQTTMSRSRLWTALGLWGPPAVLFVVIFALSSTPGNRFPEHPEIFNIVSHFVEFALLAFLLARVRSTFGLIAATMASGATMISLTSHGGVTALIVGGNWRWCRLSTVLIKPAMPAAMLQ